jgi:hypothetical protein
MMATTSSESICWGTNKGRSSVAVIALQGTNSLIGEIRTSGRLTEFFKFEPSFSQHGCIAEHYANFILHLCNDKRIILSLSEFC